MGSLNSAKNNGIYGQGWAASASINLPRHEERLPSSVRASLIRRWKRGRRRIAARSGSAAAVSRIRARGERVLEEVERLVGVCGRAGFLERAGDDAGGRVERGRRPRVALEASVDLPGGAFPVALAGEDDGLVAAGLDAARVRRQRLVKAAHRFGVLSLAHGEHGAAVECLDSAGSCRRASSKAARALSGLSGGDGKPIRPGQPRAGRGGQAVGVCKAVRERGIGLAMSAQPLEGDPAPGGNARVTRPQGPGPVKVSECRGVLFQLEPGQPAVDIGRNEVGIAIQSGGEIEDRPRPCFRSGRARSRD